MELRRIDTLPPYELSRLRELTMSMRRSGVDVVDLGFGNPDLPPPAPAVRKLQDAIDEPRNHRYSTSRGLPNLRAAMAERYRACFGVELDPEREIVHTIGAKEGCAHLMWLLLEPGDVALVPTPAYPSHLQAPALAGAAVETFPLDSGGFVEGAAEAYQSASRRRSARPRVLLFSFPNNPTAATVDLGLMRRIVEFARERSLFLVHDFAYADLGFDGFRPPSLLQVEGARECCVELYTLTKSFSMAGWRIGFALGNADVLAGFSRLKSWLDYGTFQPLQIAAITALRETPDYPHVLCEQYRLWRDALCSGLQRLGWSVPVPEATMFVWAAIPKPFRSLGSLRRAPPSRGGSDHEPRGQLRPRRRGVRPLRARRERAPYPPSAAQRRSLPSSTPCEWPEENRVTYVIAELPYRHEGSCLHRGRRPSGRADRGARQGRR